VPVREFPPITSDDLIGANFTAFPAELPIRSLFGRPAAVFSRGLPDAVRHGIERAILDLGYRYGVTSATVEVRTNPFALVVKIQYRGHHA
jgi:hypothetical protein